MFACDSPNSGDYHSPIAKRDLTPPPCNRLLLDFYGDLTWAPVRIGKKRNIGKISPIAFKLDDDEEKEERKKEPIKISQETPPATKTKDDFCLATGDSPEVENSLTKLIEKMPISHSPVGSRTPPPNEKILSRLYGDLSNAPSSNRSIPMARSKSFRPRRLFLSD